MTGIVHCLFRSPLWLIVLQAAGLALFLGSFLTGPRPLQCSKTGSPVPFVSEGCSKDSGPRDLCPLSGADRVFIFLLDGLRYDMIDGGGSESRFKGKLSFVREMVERYPDKTRMMPFLASAPTVTESRIKTLMTGSPSSLFGIFSKHYGTKVAEDNVLEQLSRQRHKVAVLGDRVWDSMFARWIEHLLPFEEGGLYEFDIVDNNILREIGSFVNGTLADDWKLLVAHFLGFDSLSHVYELESPAVEQKLALYNEVLRRLFEQVQALDGSSVFMLIGDHGMTTKGSHGGSSAEEITSGIFAFSSAGFADFPMAEPIFDQTDFAATLSSLLGIGFPCANIGFARPDFAIGCIDDLQTLARTVTTLHMNARQVHTYLSDYEKRHGPVANSEQALELKKIYSHAELLYKVQLSRQDNLGQDVPSEKRTYAAIADAYLDYFREAALVFRTRWGGFDKSKMFGGVFVVSLCIFCMIVLESRFRRRSGWRKAASGPSWLNTGVVGVLFTCSVYVATSNSYISQEAAVSQFLLQSAILFLLFGCYSHYSKTSAQSKANSAARQSIVRLIWLTALLACLSVTDLMRFVVGLGENSVLWKWLCFFGARSAVILLQVQEGRHKFSKGQGSRWSSPSFWVFIMLVFGGVAYRSLSMLSDQDDAFRASVEWTAVFVFTSALLHLCVAALRRRDDATGNMAWWLSLAACLQLLPGNDQSFMLDIALCFAGVMNLFIREYERLSTALGSASSVRTISSFSVAFWAVLFSFAGQHFFYATGHEPKFSSVRVSAGLVGMSTPRPVRSTAMIVCETFGADIALLSLGVVSVLRTARMRAGASVARLTTSVLLVFSMRAVAFMLCFATLGFHLFTEKVFMPKVVFEIARLIVVDVVIIFVSITQECRL